MVDPAALAAQLAAVLGPSIPYLLGKVADEAGREIRKDVLEQAQALWARLRPAVDARPSAAEAVEDVAAHPADGDAQAALRLQLRKLVEADPALQRELTELMQSHKLAGGTSIEVTAGGERSVAIGGNNSGSIATGDQTTRRRAPA